MEKIDLKKRFKDLYQASSKAVAFVEVPQLNYLMIDGSGDPNNSPSYAAAIEALFSVSYTIKFKLKKGPLEIDYGVMPLEGLWWADDMSVFTRGDKSQWKWTAMIMQPDFVTEEIVKEAITEVGKKKNLDLSKIRYDVLNEGFCAQILHIGPYSEEGPTIDKVHHTILTRGSLRGKHHEIYLGDMRKTDPSRWKTIIRQPLDSKEVSLENQQG
jgi:hypothetical protein